MRVDMQVDKDKQVDKQGVNKEGQEMEERMKVATSAEKVVVFQKAIAGWSKPSGEIRIFFSSSSIFSEPRQSLREWRRGGLKCQSVWSRWSLRRFLNFSSILKLYWNVF